MIPLQCPNCESEIDLVKTNNKAKLERINELEEKEKLQFDTIIEICCGGCDFTFWTLIRDWNEHEETFL